MGASPLLVDCGGSFYDSPPDFWATSELDLARSEIQVDGQDAYGSYSAKRLFAGSEELSGFPTLSATLDGVDSATGEAQTTEREPLVRCAPEDIYQATAESCKEFAATGVALSRVTRFSQNGRWRVSVTPTRAAMTRSVHWSCATRQTSKALRQAGAEAVKEGLGL